MKVKIGNRIYDSDHTPIMVLLKDEDIEELLNSDVIVNYALFPKGWGTQEEMHAWMDDDSPFNVMTLLKQLSPKPDDCDVEIKPVNNSPSKTQVTWTWCRKLYFCVFDDNNDMLDQLACARTDMQCMGVKI